MNDKIRQWLTDNIDELLSMYDDMCHYKGWYNDFKKELQNKGWLNMGILKEVEKKIYRIIKLGE